MKSINPLPVYMFLFLSLLVCEAKASTFFIAPNGNNNDPGTQANPWRTFGFAIPRLFAGDTLFVLNGTYTPGNNGFVYIDCNNGAHNGTSGAPVTIKALNERQALLAGDGSLSTVTMYNCGWWVIEGLRIESQDRSGSCPICDTVSIFFSNNGIVRRNLINNTNRCANAQALLFGDGCDTMLAEENELYNFHRNGLETYPDTNTHSIIRRNYINARGYGNGGSCAGQNGTGISMYFGHDGIIENNVVEGMPVQVMTNHGDRNRWLGNMAIGGADGLTTGRHPQYGSNISGTVYTNNLSLGSQFGNYAISDSGVTYTNNTTLNSRIGFIAGNGNDQRHLAECITQGTCWAVTPNITLMNNLSAFSSEQGFVVFDSSEFGSIVIDHNNAYGNNPNYGEGMGSATNDTQTNPNLGSCYAWIPDGSPMKGAGAGGADIGATIINRYQNGTLTTTPLWNTTTGAFPCGVVVAGVNDVGGNSCFDVHQRLHINNNGCAFPSGTVTVPSVSTTRFFFN